MFKKITLIVTLVLGCTIGVFSQNPDRKAVPSTQKFERPTPAEIEFRTDTAIINPASFADECSLDIAEFSFENPDIWGFTNGTNAFGDVAKAQRLEFDLAENYSVIGAIVFFGTASAVEDGSTTAGVWDVASDGAPNNLLATSEPLRVSELIANSSGEPIPTIFTFSEPAVLNSPQHFIDIDLGPLYETSDTVSILSTDFGCGAGISTWELIFLDENSTDPIWLPYDGTGVTPELNIDLLISSIVTFEEVSTSVESAFVKKNGLTLRPASPNPVQDNTIIHFDLDQAQNIFFELYAADGQAIRKEHLGIYSSGSHQKTISMKDLPNGSYYYGLITDQTRLMSKITKQN